MRYTPAFQEDVISACFSDVGVCSTVAEFGRTAFFQSEALQWLFRVIRATWTGSRTTVTVPIIETELTKLPPDVREIYGTVAFGLLSNTRNVNLFYTRTELVEWMRRNVFVGAMREAEAHYDSGDFEAAVAAALRGANHAQGLVVGKEPITFLLQDWEHNERLRRRHNLDVAAPTGSVTMDAALGGGLRLEEFGLLMGDAKSMKSWHMNHFATAAVRMGIPTLLVPLEGKRQQTVDRCTAAFVQQHYGTLRDQELLPDKKALLRAEADWKAASADLAIEVMTSKYSYTMLDVEEALDAVRGRGMSPRLVVVDYVDLLEPIPVEGRTKASDTYTQMGRVYRDVKRFGEKNKVAVWSVTQSAKLTRDLKWPEVLTRRKLSDSYNKARVADFIITLNHYKADPRFRNMVLWYLDTCRDNPEGVTVPMYADWENSRFYEVDNAYFKELVGATQIREVEPEE